MVSWRLAINLLFFFLGILIPLLAFQSAFAETWVESSTGSSWGANRIEGVWSTCHGYSEEPQTCDSGPVYMAYNFSGTWYKLSKSISGTGRYVKNVETIANSYAKLFYSYDYQPAPAEPDHCFNTVKDVDEIGVNCGGSCFSVCDMEGCPPGTDYFTGGGCFPVDPPWDIYQDSLENCAQGTVDVSNDPNVKICVPYQIVPDPDGNCRDGYDIAFELSSGQELCGPSLVLYSSDDSAPLMDEYFMESENPGFQPGTFSVVETEDISLTDNLDGTSSKVTTTTLTDPNNNTQTTTKTEIIDNDTNQVISSSTVTEGETNPEDDTANYNYDIGEYEMPSPDYDDPDLAEKNLDDIFDNLQSWNPFANFDDEMKITVSNPTCSLECNVDIMGPRQLGFSLCEYQWAFNAVGLVLTFVSYLYGFLVVARGR